MALIGSINEQGELQGQINGARYLTGVITNASAVGGQVVGMRGLKGDKGDTGDTGATGADGADGFSPSASVSKVDNVATITITDKDGTTTAEVYDGSGGGASAFIAEYGVTTYADVKDAYDEDAIILCMVDDSGNTAILQLAYFDDANDTFYFAQPNGEGWHWASVAIDDTWDDGSFQFATTDTATQLRDGLMSALDWQKLDGIASGAEVNVQSDWNEADSTADDYIKNKPTIPSKTSDLNNDSGFITNASLPTDFTGATSSSAGVHGLVPAPNSGGQDKVLSADGNWYNVVISEYLDLDNNDQGLRISLKDDSNATKHRYNFSFKSGINILKASTSDYGFTKLSSSTSSTSTSLAATPSAVKSAYDLAADATATPTASKKSKFDSDAHMNSTDMTTGADSELEDFIDGLNVSGGEFIKVKDYSYSYSNLTANTSLTITASQLGFDTPTGYAPIGVVTVESGHVAVEIERVSAYLDNRIRNVSSSNQSGTYALRVAYAKA